MVAVNFPALVSETSLECSVDLDTLPSEDRERLLLVDTSISG